MTHKPKHDYAAALEWIRRSNLPTSNPDVEFMSDISEETESSIIHALRLAERIMGEPSRESLNAAAYSSLYKNGEDDEILTSIFKEMIAQAIKETN